MHRLAFVALVGALVSACASTSAQRAYMDSPASSVPEGHRVWARPQEVGYNIGGEISGEASSISILFGLFSAGAEDASLWDDFASIFSSKPVDALVRAAAGDAIVGGSAPHAPVDGIYVTYSQVSTLNLFFFKRRSATVRGRALTLRPMGEVSQERADRERFLRALSGGGSGALIQVPSNMVENAK